MGENQESIKKLITKIHRVSKFIGEQEQPEKTKNPNTEFTAKYKPESKWEPKNIDPNIYKYTEELRKELNKLEQHKKPKDNLTIEERNAIKTLKDNKKIIIKPADKGSGVVILTTEQYEEEVYSQLKNPLHYKKLEGDISESIKLSLKKTIRTHHKEIPENIRDILIPNEHRPANFYILPKIHKNLEKPPGRPIMSANNHITERLSEYVDLHLKPHVQKTKAYIKDTNHFIETIKHLDLPKGSRIITYDVTALYTNIPHEEGTEAIYNFMQNYETETKSKMIAELAKAVLENNNFVFNNENYIQTSGTAMGTKMAPSYANIFMNDFEEKHLKDAPIKPIVWKRFIDDIFTILVATENEIDQFTDWLNTRHPILKFTCEKSIEGIPFLDTFVSNDNRTIKIRPYNKPTDTKQFLQPTSCHPQHITNSIPFSQALRIQRICTQEDDLKKELENLKGFFKNRGYDNKIIETGITNAKKTKKPKTEKEQPTVMVTTHNPMNPNYQKTINIIWKKHAETTKLPKPLVAYKRPKNLRDILTEAAYNQEKRERKKPPLTNRPLTTYNKIQMKEPRKHITLRCQQDHRHTTDQYRNLEEAKMDTSNDFTAQHQTCGKINIIPTNVKAEIIIKCTECKYKYHTTTTENTETLKTEILNSVDTIQKAKYRQRREDNPRCQNLTCETCKHKSKLKEIKTKTDTYGTLEPNCTDKNIVYYIQCRQCKQLYIGHTTNDLRTRYTGHKSAVKNVKNTAIANHFNKTHKIEDMEIGILDKVNTANTHSLKIREAAWIKELKTIEDGINERDERDLTLKPDTIRCSGHYKHNRKALPYFIMNLTLISQEKI